MENIIIKTDLTEEIGLNEKYRVQIKISGTKNIKDFYVLFNRQWEQPSIIRPMQRIKEEEDSIIFSTEVYFQKYGNYFFFFTLIINGEKKAIKINRKTNKPYIIDESQESPYWKILVTQKKWTVPFWAKDAIVIQIIVDRFFRGNNKNEMKNHLRNYLKWGELPIWEKNENNEFHNNCFFCGNIKGITEKLNYIQSFGVKIIYMSPIFESASIIYKYANRVYGYATTNFFKIDPDKGSEEDLIELHKKANERGIHIIVDMAFNHCSVYNPIFQEAYKNPESKYRDWFYIESDGNYKYWYDFKDMPVFNQNSKGFREYIKKVIRKWAPFIDGIRFDLGENLSPLLLKEIREEAEKYGEKFFVGECWDIKPTETFGKSGFDTPTNYPLADAIYKYILFCDGKNLSNTIREIHKEYPREVIDTMINSLDTHDTIRALNILSGKYICKNNDYRVWEIDREPTQWHKNGKFDTYSFRKFCLDLDKLTEQELKDAIEKLKIASILQYFLPGNPCIYYGTEAGLTGYKDPFSRKCFPWDNPNQELLCYYRELGKFRLEYKGENSGAPKVLNDENGLYVFTRQNELYEIFVATNVGNPQKIEIPENFKKNNCKIFNNKFNIKTGQLLRYGGIIILKHICY